MRRRGRAVADPDTGERWTYAEIGMIERKVVIRPETGEELVEIGRSDIIGRARRIADFVEDQVEYLTKFCPARGEIESRQIVGVVEPAADFGWSGKQRDHAFAAVIP